MSLVSRFTTRAHLFYATSLLLIILLIVFLRAVMIPLALAFIIAYILNPLIERLDRKHISRGIVSVSVLFLSCTVIFFACWILVPLVYGQLDAVLAQLPKFKMYVETQWLPHIDRLLSRLTGESQNQLGILKFADVVPPLLEKPQDVFRNVFDHLGQSTRFVMALGVTLVLTPVFSFFFMRDFKKLLLKMMDLVPPDLRSPLRAYFRDIDKALRSILRGQVLVVCLLMILYSTAFFIVGLPAALAVGVVTGLARFVPYLDVFVGGMLCFFILATTTPTTSMVVGVIIAFLTIQMLDGAYLTPRIMGRYAGIHPFLIILCVLCLGDWFGVVGVLFAVPVAAIARISFYTFTRYYRNSMFFKSNQAREKVFTGTSEGKPR